MGRRSFLNIILIVALISVLTEAQVEPLPYRTQRRRLPPPTTPDPEDDITSTCPAERGFFADASQCDKYYECRDWEMIEKLCPDGLVFDASRSDIEKCELSHLIDCSDRPLLQPAQPGPDCPRKNGYYAHNDSRICDKFFYCADGRPHPIICPDGLVFSNKTATCAFRDKSQSSECVFGASELRVTPENITKSNVFQCPRIIVEHLGNQVAHPLFPDPNDCQYYYICIDGITPRKSACELGQVFSEKTQVCMSPKEVPECAGWYSDVLDYDEAGEIATTTTTTPKPKPKAKPRPGGGPKRRGNPPVPVPVN